MNGKISVKKIDTHLSEIDEEEELLQARMQSLVKQLEQKQKEKDKLEKRKKRIENRGPEVTEHAILRYFERVEGRNIGEVIQKILNPNMMKLMEVLPATGTFPHPDGYSVVMKNNRAITIVKE